MFGLSVEAWGFMGAAAGPVLVFVTWVLSRRQARQAATAELMTATVNASLSTTETMRMLLQPLEQEIAELRRQIAVLRLHVQLLEDQVRELGDEPIDPSDFIGIKDLPEEDE